MPAPTLTRKAQCFVQALDDMGFGADDPINGGDCVEFIDRNQALLRKLPALCEVADAAEKLVKGRGRFHTEQNYGALVVALDKLKGA